MFNNSSEKNRYSLRKLSVGLASVFIGISFIETNGQTAKADTVDGDNTAAISTKVEKTTNASDANKGTTASNGSLGAASSANVGQENAKENGSQNYSANDSAEATTAKTEATAAKIQGAKAALDAESDAKANSTAKAANTSDEAAKVATTDVKIAANGNSVTISGNKQQSTEDTAKTTNGDSLQSNAKVINDQFKQTAQATKDVTIVNTNDAQAAKDTQALDVNKNSNALDSKALVTNLTENNTNPVKESHIKLTVVGKDLSDQKQVPAKTNGTVGDSTTFGFTGQFTVDSSALSKKGTHVDLAFINESNNYNLIISMYGSQDDWNCMYNGQVIGKYHLTSVRPHQIILQLLIDKDQDFIGDVKLTASSPHLFFVTTGNLSMAQTKDITKDKPLVSTLSTSDDSYQFIYQPRTYDYHEIDYPNHKTWTFQNGQNAAAETSYIPFISDDYNKTDIAHELENSHGKSMSAKLQNLRRVVQLSGNQIPQNIDGYVIIDGSAIAQIIDADGKMTSETVSVPLNRKTSITKVALADNLTPQEVYDQTPGDSYGFSKQKDGSFIIGWNLTPQAYKMNASDIEKSVRTNSYIANIADPSHADQIVKNTVDFYEGALQGTPLNLTFGVYLGASYIGSVNLNTDFTIKDLTPGDSRHEQATGFIGTASGTSTGNTARYVSVQIIDDDNNQMLVGKPNILRGKTGDTEKIEYTVPKHYELVAGQNIPSTYVLKDSNSPIVIHLKHVRDAVKDDKYLKNTSVRTITFDFPAGHGDPETITQTIGWTRTGTYDEVTAVAKGLDEAEKEGNYTDWVFTSDPAATKVTVTVNGKDDAKLAIKYQAYDQQAYAANNSDVEFAAIPIPKILGYKATFTHDSANPAMLLVSFMALPNTSDATKDDNTETNNPTKPTTPSDDTKSAIDVPVISSDPKDATPKLPIATPSAPIEVKSTQDITFDEPVEAPAVQTTTDSVWHIKDDTNDTSYIVVNAEHILSLPKFTGYTLRLVKRNAARDAISFVYVNPNKTLKYIFNIKLTNGKYILTIGKVTEDGIMQLEKVTFSDYNQLIALIAKAVNR